MEATANAPDAPQTPEAPKKSLVVPIVIAVVVIAALFVLFKFLPIVDWLKAFQAYVKGLGFAGYVLYALVYAVCCVLFVPASVLTLGAGAIYGLGTGTAVVLAKKNGLPVSALSSVIHAYPSLGEITGALGREYLKSTLTPGKKRFLEKLAAFLRR